MQLLALSLHIFVRLCCQNVIGIEPGRLTFFANRFENDAINKTTIVSIIVIVKNDQINRLFCKNDPKRS